MHDESVDYGLYLRRWLSRPGNSQRDLAKRVPCSPAYLIKIKNGEGIPDDGIAGSIDQAIGAGGQFHRAVQIARQQRAIGRNPVTATVTGSGSEVEVSATDRRQFGEVGLAAILAVAGMASDEMATADPTPLTLKELEAEADTVGTLLYTVPAAVLLQRAASGWHETYTLLRRPVSGGARRRLLHLAGTFSCRAASLALRGKNDAALRQFGTLAEQYAQESGDPLLVGEVANLRSRTAFERGLYRQAADIATRGLTAAHPALQARLAACAAEALAAEGRPAEAREALAAMRNPSVRPTRWTEGDETIFGAATLARLGDWPAAGELAERYVSGVVETDGQGIGWAHTVLGGRVLAGDKPDPDTAARHGTLALAAPVGPDAMVAREVTVLHGTLTRRWPDVPAVRDLGEAAQAARKALPAGPTV